MAAPEELGGISIDIGVNDAGVDERLSQLERRLERLVSQTYKVKVTFPGQQGRSGPGTPGGTPIQLNATLKIESAAAKRDLKATFKDWAIPVQLKVTQTEINKLKRDIKAAFENFEVPIKLKYTGMNGQPIQVTGGSFVNVGGGGGSGGYQDDEEVPGTGGSVRRSSGRGRTVSLGPRTLQRDTVTQKLTTLVETLTKQRTEALYANTPRTALNQMQRDINYRERQLAVVQSSPDDVALRQYPDLRQFAGGTGVSRPRKRGLVAKPPVIRRAPTISEAIAAGVAPEDAPRYVSNPSAYVERRAPIYTAGPTLRGPEALAAEAQESQRRRMAGIQGMMEGNGNPTERSFREFDRTRPDGRSGRRRGPIRSFAMSPRAGFLSPFAPNDVQRQYDPRGPYPQDPELFGILERFRRGGYGTRAEPAYGQLDDEGQIQRVFQHSPDRFAAWGRRGISLSPGGTPFRSGNRTLQILSPGQLARRAARMTGIQAGSLDSDKFLEALKSPNFDPDRTNRAMFGGGYKGVSTGFGPAAVSMRDTPAGNALSRQRIAEGALHERASVLDPASRAFVMGARTTEERMARLETVEATEEQLSRRASAPYQRRLDAAFSRYQSGYAGREGGFPEGQVANPKTVYNFAVRRIANAYRRDNGIRNKGRLSGLPLELRETVSAHRAAISGDYGKMVPDYDRTTASGGVAMRYAPGEIESSARRVSGREDINAKYRDTRRGDYGPAEQQYFAMLAEDPQNPQLGVLRAAYHQEREAAYAKGFTGAPVETRGPSVLSGDEFSAKTMASARPSRAFTASTAMGSRPRLRIIQGGATPMGIGRAAEERAGRLAGDGTTERFASRVAAIPGALDRAGYGGGSIGESRTALAASGSVVPVRVVNFSELKGVALGGGGKSEAKASESKEERLAREALGTAPVGALSRAKQRELDARLRAKGFNIATPPEDAFDFGGRSPARLAAQEEIARAQSLNPARAFQSAVAASFARTIGGGAAFQSRLSQYQSTLTEKGNVGELLDSASAKRNSARSRLDAIQDLIEGQLGKGTVDPDLLEKRRQLMIERKAAQVETDLLSPEAQRINTQAEKERQDLITPGGVARGFAALGAGAIVGGLAFSAASQAVQAAIGMLEDQAAKAADALSGFALTTNKVAASIGDAIRTSSGNVPGALAGIAAPIGMSQSMLQSLGLDQRGLAIAASQNRVASSDLFRTGGYLGGRGGFDQQLFGGTGGVLNSALFAPQPGFMERITDDVARMSGIAPFDPLANGIRNTPFLGAAASAFGFGNAPTAQPELRAKYVADLNEQLGKANSSFRVLTDATDAQKTAMMESATSIGQGEQAARLIASGVVFAGPDGRGLSGNQYGQAASELAKGQTMVDPETALAMDKRAMEAQLRAFGREQQHQLDFTIPTEESLTNLARPLPEAGSSLAAANAKEQASIEKSVARTAGLQKELDDQYAIGNDLLKQALPPDLYNGIKATGEAIAKIQSDLAKSQATLQAHEYANAIRVAERSLKDIQAIQGKRVKGEYDGLGYIEKQNIALQRQSQMLAMQLQQRQINFQLAIAGFQTPGDTPEERAARRQDAQTQASFAQKQLDIQKKMFGNEIKVFDIQNLRAAEDAIKSIALLQEGRAVSQQSAAAAEEVARLEKKQEMLVKRAGTYLQRIEKEVGLAQGELQKLEAAYGEAVHGITLDSIRGFSKFARELTKAMNAAFGGGGMTGTENNPGKAKDDKVGANGLLGITSGQTSFIAGEVKGEAVAILKNPKLTSGGFGGGGATIIQINNPVVREEQDIQKIASAVEQVLNRRVALMGLRN